MPQISIPLLLLFFSIPLLLQANQYNALSAFFIDKSGPNHKISQLYFGQSVEAVKQVTVLTQFSDRKITGLTIDPCLNALYFSYALDQTAPRNVIGGIAIFDIGEKKTYTLQETIGYVPISVSVDYLQNTMAWADYGGKSLYYSHIFPSSPVKKTTVDLPRPLTQVILLKNTSVVYQLVSSDVYHSTLTGDQLTSLNLQLGSTGAIIAIDINHYDMRLTYMGRQWRKVFSLQSKSTIDFAAFKYVYNSETIATIQVPHPPNMFASVMPDTGDCQLARIDTLKPGMVTYTGLQCDSIYYLTMADNFYSAPLSKCGLNGVVDGEVCTCREGWVAPNCTVCDSEKLCGGNGDCDNMIGACSCYKGYSGQHCEQFSCFQVPNTDPCVCSGFGKCVNIDRCQCDSQHAGDDCSYPVCFGKSNLDKDVCSSRGICNLPDACSCNGNYSGMNCQFSTCSTINSTDINVCSSHGTCTDFNHCECQNGYSGQNCENTRCFDVPSTDPTVCNGRGKCTRFNHCECNEHYSGEACKQTTCFNKTSSDPTVCSGRGTCNSYNNCTCNEHYGGEKCKETTCFGKSSLDTNHACFGRGTCVSFDSCECISDDYYGAECNITTCFQTPSDDPLVCSGKGRCIDKDNCSCNEHYHGVDCNLTTCDDIPSESSSACSSHGKCLEFNYCDCDIDYSGLSCQFTHCGVFNSSDPAACSSHGTCTGLNNCTCSTWYFGDECNATYCYGIKSTDDAVCNKRGTCQDFNNCSCYNHYSGDQCTDTTCFGVASGDSNHVCSGRGNCTGYDTCQCTSSDYFGPTCNFTTCYGISSTELATVCNGNGVCIDKDNCSCHTQFHGQRCQWTICFGIPSEDHSVCNGNGKCISYNHCQCHSGYTGTFCNITACFNVSSLDVSVCSHRGICVSPNNCTCIDPIKYQGPDCSVTTCFGFTSTKATACHGHGKCIDYDTCLCNEMDGYLGPQCEVYYCFGELYNSSTVCSGNGICIKPNQCRCNDGHGGLNCSVMQCFSKNATDPTACDGHGSCLNPNRCQCIDGYLGSTCQYPICFDMPSNDTQSCSNHGTCVSPNTCICDNSFSGIACQFTTCFGVNSSDVHHVCNGHGSCISNSTCICHGGFRGEQCQSNVALSVSLSLVFGIGGLLLVLGITIILSVVLYKKYKRNQEAQYEEEYKKLLSGSLTLNEASSTDGFGSSSFTNDTLGSLTERTKSEATKRERGTFTITHDTNRWKITFEQLKDLTECGVGTSSVVYHAKWKTQLVAVKLFKNTFFDSNTQLDEFENEVNVLVSLNHPNILLLYGVVFEPPKIATVTEYCPKGSLFDLIRNENLSWERTVNLTLNIALGMGFLHAKHVIHRDLKSANIFIDRNYVPKIADFGISKIVETQSQFTKKVGTSSYMAPEITLGKPYSDKCDVFSFAIIMYEMYYGTTRPYAGHKITSQIELMVANDTSFRPIIPSPTAPGAKKIGVKEHEWYLKLMQLCWNHNPNKRPSFEQIVEEIERNL